MPITRRLFAAALVTLAALPGCAWGVRGGPEVVASAGGSALVQATITGVAGFGSTSRWQPRNVSDGIVFTGTLSAGGDARLGGGTLSGAGGMAWFNIPEEGRWGWTVGFEGGGRARGQGPAGGEVIFGLRGGPLFRLLSRADGGGRLVTLGLDLTFGAAMPADDTRDEGGLTVGLALTLGLWDVNVFHL